MNKPILPKEADVSLRYECPSCDSDHWHTLQEAKTPGFMIVCWCGKTSVVEAIVGCRMNLTTKSQNINKAKKVLSGMGFSKEQIAGGIAMSQSKEVSQIVKDTLAWMKE